MCAYVCASACVCVRARACQSARDAFLILGNQKQIIREKTQAALEINWAQMEAGNKKKRKKERRERRWRHSKSRAREEGREGIEEGHRGERQDEGRTRWGRSEERRRRRGRGEERTRGERVSKRTGMMLRKREEWEERDRGSSHALCKGSGLNKGVVVILCVCVCMSEWAMRWADVSGTRKHFLAKVWFTPWHTHTHACIHSPLLSCSSPSIPNTLTHTHAHTPDPYNWLLVFHSHGFNITLKKSNSMQLPASTVRKVMYRYGLISTL